MEIYASSPQSACEHAADPSALPFHAALACPVRGDRDRESMNMGSSKKGLGWCTEKGMRQSSREPLQFDDPFCYSPLVRCSDYTI